MAAGEAPSLESEIDALYQAPLDAFTAARNALAGTLRRAKRRDEAERVKALAKPSATAWAVNHVWWHDPAALGELLEAGTAERQAQAARAGGRAVDVRAAAARRERAVAAVVEAAVRALGKSGGAADTRYRLAGTVEALASSGLPKDVAPGRLTRDLQSSGLEALGAAGWAPAAGPPGRPVAVLSPVAAGPAATPPPRAPAAERRQAEQLAEATARLRSQEAVVEAATREASALNASLEEARAAADSAAARVAHLERQLDDARTALGEARRTLNDATRAASEADMRRARAVREQTRLRDEVDAPGGGRIPR